MVVTAKHTLLKNKEILKILLSCVNQFQRAYVLCRKLGFFSTKVSKDLETNRN